MQTSLLILGASARAAAWSALRAGGFTPYCIDLFADSDLQSNCTAHRLDASVYPRGLIEAARLLIEAARRAPPGPWLYTGALENHPQIIDIIARERKLWGNPGAVVRRVRSPKRVAEILRNAGISCPRIAEGLPADPTKTWLIKRRKSAGGAHIREWRGQSFPRDCFLQERVEGTSCSALFLGKRDDAALFLDATKQLVGISWLSASGFRYCGNIGPLQLSADTGARLQQLGDALVKAFRLRGLFGVDFILRDKIPWPVEINPRYTAGMEILDRAYGASLITLHPTAFEPDAAAPPIALPRGSTAVHGKVVLYARAPLVFPCDGPWQSASAWSSGALPEYADVPYANTEIKKGQPIITLFACAKTESECLDALRKKAAALDRRLYGQ